ncbi:MAG TPA: fibronectin type III domain-containing protein [Solirubrobacteraceae bacterium]
MGAAIGAVAIVALAIVPAHAETDGSPRPPTVASLSAKNVGPTTATLSAEITPHYRVTSYRFDYGPSSLYGLSTGGTVTGGNGAVNVSASIQSLSPATAYHLRIVVWNAEGSSSEVGRPFTTQPAPAAAAPAPATPTGTTPAAAPAPEPAFGETAVVAPVEGTVRIREPGSRRFVVLGAADAVPVGSLIHTRDGAVRLTSALPGGRTQSATFGDGLFQVRQSKTRKGLTDIVLRGGDFSACGSRSSGARAGAAAVASRKRPRRRLWARDRGGRFRTHGRNSVATVRGTRWVTTDTCAGTRTSVTAGSVSVRDLRAKRTVVVRKGRSYLARGRR